MITVNRKTNETDVNVSINIYGTGKNDINTGVPFLDHMLEQLARHSLIDLIIKCNGDIYIDDHHSVEDIGITLGQALNKSLGDKRGITRYGYAYIPLDEALSRVVIDLSGRPGLHMTVDWTRLNIGKFDTELIQEFFQGFVNHALVTLHIDNIKGSNAHHQAETIFKAFAKSLKMAISIDNKQKEIIPSTKGAL